MPARTNEFQRLILTIEQLTAVAGATVEESAMLEDLATGARREVDVLVTVPGGPRSVRVGVECRDHARPADVTWIEQLHAKYASLPVDRVVAVARRGFTAEAVAKARYLKVDTLSLAAAEAYDWAAAVRGHDTGTFCLDQLVVRNLEVLLQPGVQPPESEILWTHEIAYADGTRRTLRALSDWLLAQDFAQEGQARTFRALPDETSAAPVQFTAYFPSEPVPFASLVDPAGTRYAVNAVVISGECRRGVATVPVEQANLGATAIFHGRTQIWDASIHFAAAQREGGPARLRATVEHRGTVLPMEETLVPPDAGPSSSTP